MSEIKWPRHDASLTLQHNDHKSFYQTVQQVIDTDSFRFINWVSEEQRQKAIDTNDAWTLQWYPNTPVGFCALAAADLDVLLAAALDDDPSP